MTIAVDLGCKATKETDKQFYQRSFYEPANGILILITLLSSEGSWEYGQIDRIVRAFAPGIHKVWI